MEEEPNQGRDSWWLRPDVFAGLAALALVVWGLLDWYLPGAPPNTRADFGSWGDAFAPVSAFLSAFAVIAALQAIRLQRVELGLQRNEMREARKQFTEQTEEQRRANELAELSFRADIWALLDRIDARALAILEPLFTEARSLGTILRSDPMRGKQPQKALVFRADAASAAWYAYRSGDGEAVRAAADDEEFPTDVLDELAERWREAHEML